jgi:nucleotide-binding universal stress UspA family protein
MFHKVLVPLDRSSFAEQALGQAAAIARASNGDLDLVVVHEPLPFDGFGDAPWNAEQWKAEEAYLQSIANELSTGTSVPVTCAVVRGQRVDAICKRAWDIQADLIVMTSHGRTGINRAWLGSAADGVIRHAAMPVLMLRPAEGNVAPLTERHLFKHVLVPLDGSALAKEALPPAIALATCNDATITLLRVVPPVPAITIDAGLPFVYPSPVATPDDVATGGLVAAAQRELAALAKDLAEQGVPKVDTEVVVAGQTARAIIEFAGGHGVDVITMSTHGRGASRLLLGSVADKVIRACGLPVLVHRPIAVRNDLRITEASVVSQLPALAGA